MLDDLYTSTSQRANKKEDITIVKKALNSPIITPFYCPSSPTQMQNLAPPIPFRCPSPIPMSNATPEFPSRPPIGYGVQETVPSIAGNVTLLWALLKKPGLNLSSGNSYTSPKQEHEMKVEKLTSDILPSLPSIDSILKNISPNQGLLEASVIKNELHDSPFSDNSSHQLQGDIQENGDE